MKILTFDTWRERRRYYKQKYPEYYSYSYVRKAEIMLLAKLGTNAFEDGAILYIMELTNSIKRKMENRYEIFKSR